MQLLKYVNLTLCQQQHPDLEVNKVTCQKGLLKKMRKKAKNMNLTQNFYMEKLKSVTLTLSQSMSGDGTE